MNPLKPSNPGIEELLVKGPVMPPVGAGIQRAASVRVSAPRACA
jgi:hypothetical protein